MDILNILKDVGIVLTDQQKKAFKQEFHKHYKSVCEIRKLKSKIQDFKSMVEMYKEELEDFKNLSNGYQEKYEEVYKNLVYLQNNNMLRDAGILNQYANFVQKEVLQYVNGNTDFKMALIKYVKEHPQYTINKS